MARGCVQCQRCGRYGKRRSRYGSSGRNSGCGGHGGSCCQRFLGRACQGRRSADQAGRRRRYSHEHRPGGHGSEIVSGLPFDPGTLFAERCMAASGSVIKWFQNELAGGASLDVLDKEAELAGPGADGLVSLPYFLGEKTPIHDPHARGMFVGLHLGHKRGHLFRAILEGIGFGFYHHIETFAELGLTPQRVRITNGGSRSRVWRQIVADISGLSLESIIDHPGSSLGAAFAAGVGSGVLTGWDEIDKFIKVEERIEPNKGNTQQYQELYRVYRSIYPNLLEQQHQLARFSRALGD
ncbi:FGGY-family carbohydrate kinase [Gordoniibacillus kamchatkensis]|uniref:FGGY-family carbohydrate kinase n=1 Tax=Gordoniibacillus kamchatkensis TaxID=1590651 RepID=UPI0022B124ED|nr:FGGY-family carbohydrate kinase [Paenibacillus sp. VKM B-2647]